ncbi:unnamed protein product, partial [Cyprideis torosa]
STGETRGLELASSNEEEMSMMLHSRRLWEELQDSTGETLLKPCGSISITDAADNWPLSDLPRIMETHAPGVAFKWLTPAELTEELSKVVYPDVTGAISDGSGALLLSAKCLRVIHREFTVLGGTVLDDRAVVEIIPEYSSSEDCAAVRLRQTSSPGESESLLKAKKILVCCGAWSAGLVKPLGLDIPINKELSIQGHFQLKDTKSELSRCGIMEFRTNPKPSLYGWCHPPFALPNKVKLGLNLGEDIPKDFGKKIKVEHLRYLDEYVRQHFSAELEVEPEGISSCINYCLADYLHCVGPVPKSPSVLIGLPSGPGFKLCPSFGSILAAMALGKLSQEIESINIKEDTLKTYYPDRFVPSELNAPTGPLQRACKEDSGDAAPAQFREHDERSYFLLLQAHVFAHDLVKHKSDKEHHPDHEHHDHKVAGRSHHDSPKEGPEYHESLKEGPEYHDSPKEGPEYHETPKEGSEYHDTPKTYISSHYEPEPYDSSKPYSEKHTDQEWNAYYGQEKPGKFYDDFEFKVIDVNLRNGGRYEANRDWKVDCNTYENYRGNGLYMIAIYDNYDRFGDIDLVKCVGQKDS